MDSRLLLERAENELVLAKIIFKTTEDKNIQKDIFTIDEPLTFYSAVISHCYYCIFYSAKAYLLKKGIKIKPPREHNKVFEHMKKLTEEGILDVELLKLYEKLFIKAESLLGIFEMEKNKRGKFTYRKLAQANRTPAKESLANASTVFRHMYNLSQKNN